jgi:hypothetical protein
MFVISGRFPDSPIIGLGLETLPDTVLITTANQIDENSDKTTPADFYPINTVCIYHHSWNKYTVLLQY